MIGPSALFVAAETSLTRLPASDEGWAAPETISLEGRVMAMAVSRHDRGSTVHLASSARDGRLLTVRTRGGGLDLAGDVATAGVLPCSIAVAPSGRHLAVANYRTGSIGIHPLDDDLPRPATHVRRDVGSGPDERRQDGSHPHAVLAHHANLLAVDLGADRLSWFAWGADGSISLRSSGDAAPGSGPRHAAIVGDRWIVTADELGASVSLYRFDERTTSCELVDRLCLPRVPADAVRDYPADVVVVGDSVYVATRGADVVTQLSVGTGRLVAVDEVASGRWPLKLAHVRGELYCAARDDDAVEAWSIDRETGRLSGRRRILDIERPVWVAAD